MECIAPGELGSRAEFQQEWCKTRGDDNWMLTDPPAFRSFLRSEHMMLRRTRAEVGR